MNKGLTKKVIISSVIVLAIVICVIVVINLTGKKPVETNETNNQYSDYTPVRQTTVKLDSIEKIIADNEKTTKYEEMVESNIDIEFKTQYRKNDSLAKGKIQILQEGQDGIQHSIIKNTYQNNQLIGQEIVTSEIVKPSTDKIVEIGTAENSSTYVPIVGDELEIVTANTGIKADRKLDAQILTTVSTGDIVKLVLAQDNWYQIQSNEIIGWVEKPSVIYHNPNKNGDGDENMIIYSKEQLTQGLGFSMSMNKPSGLNLAQFKKVLTGLSGDKNKVIEDNAEYFYYAETQYNVNGLFLASIAIHESGYGTSDISLKKKNLFGYRAYDRDPGGSASTFATYAEGIDLVARVLAKYYLNPKGTLIYGGEEAEATYYHGSTISAVNTSYATDKNWGNAIYKYIISLYNRL